MTRILIVEDEANARDQLAKLLREAMTEPYIDADGNRAIGSIIVDEAGTVPDGREKFDAAVNGRLPYDAAILDYRLPDEKGILTNDLTLCRHISRVNKATFVLHVSAYEDDAVLREHLSAKHSRVGQATADFIDKSAGWTERVVPLLRSQIYGRQIVTQKRAIFPDRDQPRRMLGRRQMSLTHSVGALLRDVMTYWNYLDLEVQEEIEDVMIVQKNDDGTVFASLI
jgi:CheY-like chemotaxis protein